MKEYKIICFYYICTSHNKKRADKACKDMHMYVLQAFF